MCQPVGKRNAPRVSACVCRRADGRECRQRGGPRAGRRRPHTHQGCEAGGTQPPTPTRGAATRQEAVCVVLARRAAPSRRCPRPHCAAPQELRVAMAPRPRFLTRTPGCGHLSPTLPRAAARTPFRLCVCGGRSVVQFCFPDFCPFGLHPNPSREQAMGRGACAQQPESRPGRGCLRVCITGRGLTPGLEASKSWTSIPGETLGYVPALRPQLRPQC